MMSHAAPKFQPSRVQFRGLTMEAAQWTLTSQQLQHIVSTAIRQSADASAIRILPEETLERGLPEEIDRLDHEILTAIRRRSEISRAIGRTRMLSGGTKLVHTRELKVYQRFSELGEEGHTLAGLLLRLGRGRLG